MINRRNFLKASAASTLGGATALDVSMNSSFAATNPSDYKSLVCVFLDGGNDSFNMLMPNTTAEYNAYARSRQAIAIERSALQTISPNGLAANSFGLHPEMSALKRMFDDGDASLIANVGPLIEPTSKSDIANGSVRLPTSLGGHNTGRSYWKGDHDNSVSSSQDGIGGRLSNEFVSASPLPMTISSGAGYDLFVDHASEPFYGVPASGLVTMHDYDLGQPNRFASAPSTARRAALAKLNQMGTQENNLLLQHSGQLFTEGLELNLTAQNFLNNIEPLETEFPLSPLIGLSRNIRNAAELISIREQLGMKRQIIFVRASGFDRHDRLRFWHDPAMAELSNGLAAFNSAMKELGVH